MKTYLILLSLCFFYTYSAYSADDKCPFVFEDGVPVVDLKDIKGGHYRTGKFNYESNEKREYVLSQDTPSIYLDGGIYRKGTLVSDLREFDNIFLMEFGKEVLSQDIPGVEIDEGGFYPKGMPDEEKVAIQKRLEMKFPHIYRSQH